MCGACDQEAAWVINGKWLVCDLCVAEVRRLLRIYHAVRIAGRSLAEEKVSIRPLTEFVGPEPTRTSSLPFFAKAKADAVAAESTDDTSSR